MTLGLMIRDNDINSCISGLPVSSSLGSGVALLTTNKTSLIGRHENFSAPFEVDGRHGVHGVKGHHQPSMTVQVVPTSAAPGALKGKVSRLPGCQAAYLPGT